VSLEVWGVGIPFGILDIFLLILMCQSIFAKKPTKMFRHLGYKGPSNNYVKGVFVC
jgi:hypothetical protein